MPFKPFCAESCAELKQSHMEREVHNYIRTMRTGYSVQSEFEYARLRKVMDSYLADLSRRYLYHSKPISSAALYR